MARVTSLWWTRAIRGDALWRGWHGEYGFCNRFSFGDRAGGGWSDNLYIAQAGAAHNVLEVYASGTRRVVAGSGTTAGADGVPAAGALLVAPSSVVLGPNGLSIADAGGHLVYTVDGAGTIHVVAGNGTAITSVPGQALGTALLWPLWGGFGRGGRPVRFG